MLHPFCKVDPHQLQPWCKLASAKNFKIGDPQSDSSTTNAHDRGSLSIHNVSETKVWVCPPEVSYVMLCGACQWLKEKTNNRKAFLGLRRSKKTMKGPELCGNYHTKFDPWQVQGWYQLNMTWVGVNLQTGWQILTNCFWTLMFNETVL